MKNYYSMDELVEILSRDEATIRRYIKELKEKKEVDFEKWRISVRVDDEILEKLKAIKTYK